MVDTVRTISTLLSALFQDGQASGSISPQDVRDLIVSVARPEASIAYAASIAWDLNVNPVAYTTLTGNPTITLSNGENGRSYRFALIQGGAGGFVPTFAGATVLGTPVWRSGVGAYNLVLVDVVNGTRLITVV